MDSFLDRILRHKVVVLEGSQILQQNVTHSWTKSLTLFQLLQFLLR
jgi:hypothetical protein